MNIHKLNDIAVTLGGFDLSIFLKLVRTQPTLKLISQPFTSQLSKMGIKVFLIPNESGWGDMPMDTISDLENNQQISIYDQPYLIGNLVIDPETHQIRDNSVYFNHDHINHKLSQQVIKIGQKIFGNQFDWTGKPSKAILIKIK